MTIADAFQKKDDLLTGKGTAEKNILEAERKLGLSFAVDYREYLKKYTLAMYDGHELTGLGNSERTNVVSVTNQQKQVHSDIPEDWYVLEEANIDGIIIWQDFGGNIYINKKLLCSSLAEYIENY